MAPGNWYRELFLVPDFVADSVHAEKNSGDRCPLKNDAEQKHLIEIEIHEVPLCFAAPARQSGRLVAREHRNTRPAYSPKVLYSAGRPT